jgi:hypothetical protein
VSPISSCQFRTLPDSATLDFGAGQDFSLEAWIKPQDSGNSYGVATILSKRYAPGAGTLGYELYLIHGVLGLRMDDPQNLYAFQSSSADLRDGNFHHVAATVDRDSTSGLKLYVDGVVVGTFNPTVVPGDLSNSEPWRIGNHPTPSLNCFFKGIIDEPAVYGRALGPAEIQAIYHAGVAGKIDPTCVAAPANIVAWWPGDGNGYDLARINFATPSGATYAPAVASQGFSFDGVNDGVTAAHDNALNLVTADDDVTVAAWIKPLANTTYGVMSVIGKRYTPNAYTTTGYEMFLINGVPGFQIMNSSGVATFIATGDLRDGSYHHVAATLDRSSTNGGKIYVDGTAILTFNPTVLSGSLANNDPVRIGVHPQPGFNGWYKGIIDEPTIYRRALSGAEITALYAAGSAGKCKTDTDGDGLTDLQENFLGTNPNDADTDNDGLTDGDEVFVHYTDPNNADTDGDGLPDGWEWNHFGSFAEDGNGDYDNDGATNLQEYLNGTDPNTIKFNSSYDNLYVSNRTVNGSCEILGGFPAFMAVLVNDTNLSGVSWQTYSSNFSATLPDADGVHTVLVALRGRTTDFPAAWDETEFTLDRVPPVLQITNPVSATVIKPYLQLLGLANESLASLSYDLTNASGLLTNESAFVVDQYFDTNQFDFTTNYFQAYDVELTNGLNTITLTVSDLAGNVTITNLNVTLDYSTATNPPVMQLLWPTNGAHLSGEIFNVRGWINDETASVKAHIVDGGVTNEFPGLVERNGTFWVESLPLAAGTNLVTLVAEDAAGNLSSTNLSVVQSSVTVTIISTPEGESLYEPYGLVYGTVSDPDYEVTVNGVAALVDEYGYWWAEQVPLIGRGTATFDVVASVAGGGAPVAVSESREMPARIEVVEHRSGKGKSRHYVGGNFNSGRRTKQYKAGLQAGPAGEWTHTFHGRVVDRSEWPESWWQEVYEWTPAQRTTHGTDSTPYEWWDTNIAENFQQITCVPDKDVRGLGEMGGPPPIFIHHYYARGVRHEWKYPDGSNAKAAVSARTEMKLYTGGKAGIKRKSLIHINAHAEQYGRPPDEPWLHTPTAGIPATRIRVLGWWLFGRQLDPSGDLYVALPDNAVKNLNLRVRGVKHYGAWATVAKLRLELDRVTFIGTACNIQRDDGTGAYSAPHWQTNDTAGTVTSHPVLYVSGSEVEAGTGFKLTGNGSFPVIVKGKVSGGATSFTLWGTNDGPAGPICGFYVYPDKPLTSSRVDFYNPMKIQWQYSHTSKLDFLDAGTSLNQVYVSWYTPTVGNRFHSVVDVACRNAVGQTVESNIVAGIWSAFAGLSVMKSDGTGPLRYWGPFAADPANSDICFSTADLLKYADGKCGAWQEFMWDTLSLHGISSGRHVVTPPPFAAFFIYASLAGQGGTPLVRGFINHAVNSYGGILYDPSYGTSYTSKLSWEDASVELFIDPPTSDSKGVLQTTFTPDFP